MSDKPEALYMVKRLQLHADNKTKSAMQRDCQQAADEIERLHAECERLRVKSNSFENRLDGIAERARDAGWPVDFPEDVQELMQMEIDRLRAVLSESADFWAHYSSLNESEQDELNPKRHETLDAMRNASKP